MWACAHVYHDVCGGQSEGAGEGHEHWETISWLLSTHAMVYLTCQQEHRSDGLTSHLKDSWWFIGAQSGAEMNAAQDHGNGSTSKYVDLWLMWYHWHDRL